MALECLRAMKTYMASIMVTCMCVLQFHIIARGDDVCHLKLKQLEPHPTYDFALLLMVTWSKSIIDERQCPPQILLGALDPAFCVLLHLSLHVENWIARGNACAGKEGAFLFTADSDEIRGPANMNKTYRNVMKKVYQCAEFVAISALVGGKLGIHSLRKFAATFARAMGMHSEDVDVRGRWKTKSGGGNSNKVVDPCYISPDQLFVDANVTATLCLGSPMLTGRVPKRLSGCRMSGC